MATKGLTAKEVAVKMGKAVRTVQSAAQKLGIKKTAEGVYEFTKTHIKLLEGFWKKTEKKSPTTKKIEVIKAVKKAAKKPAKKVEKKPVAKKQAKKSVKSKK